MGEGRISTGDGDGVGLGVGEEPSPPQAMARSNAMKAREMSVVSLHMVDRAASALFESDILSQDRSCSRAYFNDIQGAGFAGKACFAF